MLSRRNVRIKILQLLYCRSIIGDFSDADVIAQYRRMLDNTYDLYIYSLYQLIEVARQSVADQKNRAKKHLPTEEDKKFTPRLFNNDLIQNLETNEDLQELFRQLKLKDSADKDMIKQIYKGYMKEERYIEYSSGSDTISDTDALLDLYRYLRKNELCEEMLEDRYYSWLDDKSLIVGAMKKTIKSLPREGRFFEEHLPEDETTEEFGMQLLLRTLEEEEETLALIKPKLDNWEVDRLATLDIIILQMSLNEMIAFSSIPTKATLNEYVEIAKNYSTDKSKEFVNGILDSLMKDLVSDGVIVKTGRGLK